MNCQMCFKNIEVGYVFQDRTTKQTKVTCYTCYLSLKKNRQYQLIFRGVKVDKVLGKVKNRILSTY